MFMIAVHISNNELKPVKQMRDNNIIAFTPKAAKPQRLNNKKNCKTG